MHHTIQYEEDILVQRLPQVNLFQMDEVVLKVELGSVQAKKNINRVINTKATIFPS